MDFFTVPRRYNFPIPVIQKSELKRLTKSERLNHIIKRLVMESMNNNSELYASANNRSANAQGEELQA